MIQFLTNKEAKTRIAELCAEITANGGTAPTNCDGFKTSGEARAEIAQLENILAECRAKKAGGKGGTAPLIACLSEKTTSPDPAKAAAAVQARLDASKAAVAATAAKAKAKEAVAELTGIQRTIAAFKATAKPEAPRSNRASTRELTGLEKATAAFQAAAKK